MGQNCISHTPDMTERGAQVGDQLEIIMSPHTCICWVVEQGNHKVGVCLDHGGSLEGCVVVFQPTREQRGVLPGSQAIFYQDPTQEFYERDSFKFPDGTVIRMGEMPPIKLRVEQLVAKPVQPITDSMIFLEADAPEPEQVFAASVGFASTRS